MTKFAQILLLVTVYVSIHSCEPRTGGTYQSLVGVWTCEEWTDQQYRTYTVEIDPRINTNNQFVISNFYDMGTQAFAIGTFKDNILQLEARQIYTLSLQNGSGNVNETKNKIDWKYRISIGGKEIEVKAIYTRK